MDTNDVYIINYTIFILLWTSNDFEFFFAHDLFHGDEFTNIRYSGFLNLLTVTDIADRWF